MKYAMMCAAACGCTALADDPVVIYDNAYDGTSTYSFDVQAAPDLMGAGDLWMVDDVVVDQCMADLAIVVVADWDGVDPFVFDEYEARLYDRPPNDPEALILVIFDEWRFDGVGTFTMSSDDALLPRGDYFLAFTALDTAPEAPFGVYEQTRDDGPNDGFLWNPGGGLGFADDVMPLTEGDKGVVATSPNLVFTGTPQPAICDKGPCIADCDNNGELNILDFVCYTGVFQSGDEAADCNDDGVLNILDFVCFQTMFAKGC